MADANIQAKNFIAELAGPNAPYDRTPEQAERDAEIVKAFCFLEGKGTPAILALLMAYQHVQHKAIARLKDRIVELETKPGMKYVGTYDYGRQYNAGEFCTFGGSLWHCNDLTTERPGGGSKAWTLAVKHGKDAR